VTVCRVILYAPGRALFPPFQSSVPKLRPYPGRNSYPYSTTISARHIKSFKYLSQSLHLPKFPRPAAGRHPTGYSFSSPSTQVSKLAVGRHPTGYSFSSQSLSFLGRQQGDTLRAMVPLLSLRVSVSSHATTLRPEFPSRL